LLLAHETAANDIQPNFIELFSIATFSDSDGLDKENSRITASCELIAFEGAL
jgi:hypothetical protein